jgi:hypothetical protein
VARRVPVKGKGDIPCSLGSRSQKFHLDSKSMVGNKWNILGGALGGLIYSFK